MPIRKGMRLETTPNPKAKVEAPVPAVATGLQVLEKKLMTKGVREAMKKLNTTYGGRIFGVDRPIPGVEVWPTGYYDIDFTIIGRGGIPRGRYLEISGPESGGKTTIALAACANLQKTLGLVIGFVDAEHALDREYAIANGLNPDLMIYGVPSSAEQTVQMAEDFLSGKAGVPCDVVVVDSTGAMIPLDRIQKPIVGKKSAPAMAGRSKIQEALIAHTKEAVWKNQSALILISQVRMNMNPYGKQYRTTTNKALDHEFALRIEVTKGEPIIDGSGRQIGMIIRLKGEKNKVGSPAQTCELIIHYGRGLSPECCAIDAAIRLEVLEKAGSWLKLDGVQVGQGRDQARKHFENNPADFLKMNQMLEVVRKSGKIPDRSAPDTGPDLATFNEDEAPHDGGFSG